MIISMNLRWLPDFIDQKQLVRLEPIRYNFQPTSHDSLAQAPGSYTLFIDESGRFWKGLGEEEISGVRAVQKREIASSITDNHIIASRPVSIALQTLRGKSLAAGRYHLKLYSTDSRLDQISMQIWESERLIFNQKLESARSDLVLKFSTGGGPLRLTMDAASSEMNLAGLEIIPINE